MFDIQFTPINSQATTIPISTRRTANMASSPSKDSSAPAGSLTQRDFDLLQAAFECNKNDFVVRSLSTFSTYGSWLTRPQVDYTKFAEKTGLANANSAKASWHGLKKKLDKAAGVEVSKGKGGAKATTEDAREGDSEGAKPKTKGRKRKTPVEVADDGEEAKQKTKKHAPAAKKGNKAAAEVKETIEGEEGVKSEPDE
jgi:hypothetical protein